MEVTICFPLLVVFWNYFAVGQERYLPMTFQVMLLIGITFEVSLGWKPCLAVHDLDFVKIEVSTSTAWKKEPLNWGGVGHADLEEGEFL